MGEAEKDRERERERERERFSSLQSEMTFFFFLKNTSILITVEGNGRDLDQEVPLVQKVLRTQFCTSRPWFHQTGGKGRYSISVKVSVA